MPGFISTPQPTIHDLTAINLDKVHKAAPTLKYQPDLALSVARNNGNIANHAQTIGGLHLASAVHAQVVQHLQANPQVHQAFAQFIGGRAGSTYNRPEQTQAGYQSTNPGDVATEVGHAALKTARGVGGVAERNLSPTGIGNMEGYLKGGINTLTEQIPAWAAGINPSDPFGSAKRWGASEGYGLPTLLHNTVHGISSGLHETVFNPTWWNDQRKLTADHERQWADTTNQRIPVNNPGTGASPGRGGGGSGSILATEIGLYTPQQIADAKTSFMQLVGQEFDTWNHFYRYAVMSYQKGGINGLMNALTPMVAGAVLGMVGGAVLGPEGIAAGGAIAGELAGNIATDATVTGTAGDIAIQMGTDAASTAAEQGATTATDAAASAANEAGQTEIKLTAQEQKAADATKGEQTNKLLGSNRVTKTIGAGVKLAASAVESPQLFGANVVPQLWHDKTLWDASLKPTAELGTLGQGISEFFFHKNISPISGTVDAITSLLEAPMMGGRALALEKDATRLGSSRSLAVLSGDQIKKELAVNAQARRALNIIAGFSEKGKDITIQMPDAAGNLVDTVVKDTAGKIYRMFPSLAPIIPQLVKAMAENGHTVEVLIEEIASLADATGMLQEVRLPTAGLFTYVRLAKVGDSRAVGKISELFGQEPMRFDELTGKIVKDKIEVGSEKSIYAIGQMMQLAGEKSSKINAVLSYLSQTADPVAWSNAYINATFNIVAKDFDNSFLRMLLKRPTDEFFDKSGKLKLKNLMGTGKFGAGMNLEQALKEMDKLRPDQLQTLENFYHEYRDAWHKNVNEWIGGHMADTSGTYAHRAGVASGASQVAAEGIDAERSAALHGLQLEPFVLPDFREIRDKTWELTAHMFRKEGAVGIKNVPKVEAHELLVHDFLKVTGGLNKFVNEYFFKPLALLTPGWALRVSISELGLNTARIGPRNMLAGWLGDSFIRGSAGQIGTYREIVQDKITLVDKEITNLQKIFDDAVKKQTDTEAKIIDFAEQETKLNKQAAAAQKRLDTLISQRETKTVDEKIYQKAVERHTSLQAQLERVRTDTSQAHSELNPDHLKLTTGLEYTIAEKQAEKDWWLGKKYTTVAPATVDQLIKEQTPRDIWEEAVTPEINLQLFKLKNDMNYLRDEIGKTSDLNANTDLQMELLKKSILHDYLSGAIPKGSFGRTPTADQMEKELVPADIYRKAMYGKIKEGEKEVQPKAFVKNAKEAARVVKRLRTDSVKELLQVRQQIEDDIYRDFNLSAPRVTTEQRINPELRRLQKEYNELLKFTKTKATKPAEVEANKKAIADVKAKIEKTEPAVTRRVVSQGRIPTNDASWDWYKSLSKESKDRLNRTGWISTKSTARNKGQALDLQQDAFENSHPNSNVPWFEEMLRQIDLYNSADAIIRNPNLAPDWVNFEGLQRFVGTDNTFTLAQIHAGPDSLHLIRGLKTNYREIQYAKDFMEHEMSKMVDASGREPWQMTLKEYRDHIASLYKENLDIVSKEVNTPEEELRLEEIWQELQKWEKRDYGKNPAEMHSYLVKQAELAGSEIPARVTDSNLAQEGPLNAEPRREAASKYKAQFKITRSNYEQMAQDLENQVGEHLLAIHEASAPRRQEMMGIKKVVGNFDIRNDLERSYEEKAMEGITDRGYTVNPSMRQNISAITKGVVAGASQAMLDMIGKEEFYKASAFLVHQHLDYGTYKTSAVDAVHSQDNLLVSAIDKTQQLTEKGGKIESKQIVLHDPVYYNAGEDQKGYVDGFYYGAQGYAQDPLIANPVAKIYQKFYNMYPLDPVTVHNYAVVEVKQFLDSLPETVVKRFQRHFDVGTLDRGMTPHESWAESLVSDIENLVSHKVPRTVFGNTAATEFDHTFNPNAYKLVNDMANNNLPSHVSNFYEEYMVGADGKRYGREELPGQVTARMSSQWRQADILAQLSQVGHAKLLGPMVNQMTRNPTFVYEFVRAREQLNQNVIDGLLSADQADVLAQTRASQRMIRFIHNPADKTKFEDLMRTVAPFYFAENQAWRRMGRLFAENPGAFLQYVRAMWGVGQLTSKITAANGMAVYPIPALALFGIPLTASLSSLTTMDPLAPGSDATGSGKPAQTIWDALTPKFGPVLALPVGWAMDLIPGNSNHYVRNAAQFIEGPIAGSQSPGMNLYQALVPNSVARNLIGSLGYFTSLGGGPGWSNMVTDSYMTAKIQAFTQYATQLQEQEWNRLEKKKYQGTPQTQDFERRTDFAQWQSKTFGTNANGVIANQMLDEANRHAGIIWAAKLLGSFSPVSIGVGQADGNIRDQLKNYVTDKKFKGNYMKAVDQFIHDHPYATLQSLYETKSSNGNYMGPENKALYTYLTNNMDTVQKYPLAALAFAPDTSKDPNFYEPANQVLMSSNLRYRLTPNQFYGQFLIASGNAYYYNAIKPAYEANKKSKGIYAWKQNVMQQYGQNLNPTWYTNYTSNPTATNKIQALDQLKTMLTLPQYKNYTVNGVNVGDVYRQIIDYYEKNVSADNPNGYLAKAARHQFSYQTIADWWQSTMADIAKKIPEAAPGINAVLSNLG